MPKQPENQDRSCVRYSSLSAFYMADQQRLESRESDVGLWWREAVDGPLHRAAWVSDTGELYLVRLGPVEEGGGEVEVLAVVRDEKRLEDLLRGWRQQCGKPGSLGWLRERVTRLGERARVAHLRVAGLTTTALLAAILAV